MGPDLLVAPAVRLGRPVDAGRQHHPVLRPGLAALPGPAHPRLHRLAGRAGPRAGAGASSSSPRASRCGQPGQDVASDRRPAGRRRHQRLLRDAGRPRTFPGRGHPRRAAAVVPGRGPAPPGCTCRPTCPAAPGSSRSWSPRRTPRRSAGRRTTSAATRASCARWSGRWCPAAPGWSSTGTGTPCTTAPRRTGAASSATAWNRAGSTPSWPKWPASSAAPAECWTGCGPARRRRPGLGGEPMGHGVHGAPRRVPRRPGWATGNPTSASSPRSTAGLFDAGLTADIVAPAQLPADPASAVARWPVLVVPGTVRRRRRAAGLAARLRRRRRPSGADAAHRLRRPRRPSPGTR